MVAVCEGRSGVTVVQDLADDDPVRLMAQLDEVYARRMSDRATAVLLNQRVLELAETRGHLPAIARALFHRTLLFFSIGNLEDMSAHARRGLEIFEFLGDGRGRAAMTDRLATLAEMAGDYSSALRYAVRTRELAHQIADRPREGWALSSLGGIHAALGDTDSAVRYLQQGLELFRELDDPVGLYRIQIRMSRVFREVGRYDEAKRFAVEAKSYAQRSGNAMLLAVTDADLGFLAEVQGDLTEAEARLHSALQGFPKELLSTVAMETRIGLGRVSLKLGRVEAAREHLESVVELTQQTGARVLELDLHRCLSEVYEKLGRPAEALQHFKLYDSYREKVFNARTRQEVARLEIKMQTEAAKKDAEINHLKYVELERMQARLLETERLALLGDLAAGIAHEVNNPLGVLQSNLDLLQRGKARLRDTDDGIALRVERLLGEVVAASGEATDRIAALVRALRRFVRLDEAQRQLLDVIENLESVLTLLQPMVPDGVVVHRKLVPVPRVWGWPSELNQALMSVLTHALETLENGGALEVTTRFDAADIWIEVTGSGPELTPQQVREMFEVRLGEQERRMRLRLGLAPARSVVERHGGELVVSSLAGIGNCFAVRIPASSPVGPP
ncbi:MAG: tetratricopeptide repeat protein [Myxococcota bacterium]